MKKSKLVSSILMMLLTVAALCMGVYATKPNSNIITGSITINPANLSSGFNITAWAEKADGSQSQKIAISNIKPSGETITFQGPLFDDFLTLDFSKATTVNDVDPFYIKIEITNTNNKEVGAYFSTNAVVGEATKSDIFTSGYLENSNEKITLTSMNFYAHMGPEDGEEENLSNTATLVLEFKPNAIINSSTPIAFKNYFVNIEEYNANIKTETVTTDQITAVNGFVKLSSVIESSGAPRTSITTTTGFSDLKSSTIEDMWVVVPNGVIEIDGSSLTLSHYSAFDGCTKLIYISCPETLTTLDPYAFYGCSGLNCIVIPRGVATIGEHAFDKCTGLVSIIIPNGVTTLNMYAFAGCSKIEKIIIPKTLSHYDSAVFFGCSGVSCIIYMGSSSEFYLIDDHTLITATHSVYCVTDSVTIAKTNTSPK